MYKKIDGLLLNKQSLHSIESYMSKPGAPLLLVGSEGSGKKYTAKMIALQILGKDKILDLSPNYNFLEVSRLEKKQDISIDQIRSVYRFLKLKTSGNAAVRRLVMIYDAHYMNQEAQNALLKILEEPSSDTVFILTTISDRSVLPTIASRCQKINILPVSLSDAENFFSGKASPKIIENAWRISGGSIGLLSAIFRSENHELRLAINWVKEYIVLSTYERLIWLDKFSKNKQEFKIFLDALTLSLAALNTRAIENNRSSQANRVLEGRKLVRELRKYSASNASQKAIVNELVLNLAL